MVWWQRTRSETLVARLAGPTDRPAVADLLAQAARLHGTQAVEEQVALLNSGASSVAWYGDRAVGFLGLHVRAPADGERWVDVSLIGTGSGYGAGVDKTLATLLSASMPALHQRAVTALLCLTSEMWLQQALLNIGFREIDQVITYLRGQRPLAAPSDIDRSSLRPAGPAEANTVLALNAAAFSPIWRYDDATTLSWLLTSEHAIVAEQDNEAAGFCLTAHPTGDGYAQLIRIGVHPDWQGHGIGRRLVSDAIRYSHQIGTLGVALNTQRSNATSRHVYESLGFRTAGPAVHVLVYETS